MMLTCGATVIAINLAPVMMFFSQFVPSGLYANIHGQELYIGDFTQNPDPQCPVACSIAVRTNGKLSMVLGAKRRGIVK